MSQQILKFHERTYHYARQYLTEETRQEIAREAQQYGVSEAAVMEDRILCSAFQRPRRYALRRQRPQLVVDNG